MSVHLVTSPLRFHPLSFLDEGDEVVVGRADVDSYGVFPRDGVALLEELRSGRTVGEAAVWYEESYGRPVDIDGFVATLGQLGFTRDAATAGDHAEPEAPPPPPVRWQRLGRALFSAPAWLCFAALIAAAVAVCLVDPRFVPRPENVFFVEYLIVVELTIFLGQLPLSLLHELFHVLAGRRLGVRSRVRLAQRLHFVVFETALDGLVLVPRGQRYLPMLAGLLADVVIMAVLTLAAYLMRGPDGDLPLAGGVCLALAFTTLPRIAWQFYFFLRTDVYYLVTTVLECVDLQTTTRELLQNRVNALLGRRGRLVDPDRWHPRDRRVARWYAPLYVAGYAVSIGMLLVVVLPLAWQFFSSALGRVFLDQAVTPTHFWDSALLLTLTVLQLALAGWLALRDVRRRISGAERGLA